MSSNLNRVLKIATDKTYSGWDYTYDGMYSTPRVKGKDKKERSKYRRTLEKRITRKEVYEEIPL